MQIEVETGTAGQAHLIVVSGLPDSCRKFKGYSLSVDGDTIKVEVKNQRPSDSNIACAQVYGTVETRIPLSNIEPCKLYNVVANGKAQGVQAIAPNIRCMEPIRTPIVRPPTSGMIKVLAPIESVDFNIAESFPPQYFLAVKSGLPNGCVRFSHYEVSRDGEVIRVKVVNLAPADRGAMCTMIYGIVEHNIPLGSDFKPGVRYTVHVNDVTKTFVAQGAPNPSQPALGSEFKLGFDQTATIEPEGLVIRFLDVLEDSRCPANVVCVWAGRIKILVGVEKDGVALGRFELALEGAREDLATADVGGYLVQLRAVNPYPGTAGTETPVKKESYVATLIVFKSPNGGLAGGVLATFDVVGEQFKVWVTNPETIQQILALQRGEVQGFPIGAVLRGPGAANHNAPWSWHLDPAQTGITEASIELCDGTPSYLEEHLAEWIETVKSYCPWSARLVDVKDYR